MYKISVPIMLEQHVWAGREKIVEHLRALDAKRVFLALGTYTADEEKIRERMELLAESVKYFKALGFEVGCWLWTFQFPEPNSFTKMKSVSGKEAAEVICPTDEAFCQYAEKYLARVAATGVELIQFDDDFRMGFIPGGLGCVCDNHIALLEKYLGRKLPENADLAELLLTDANEYRSAWQKAKRESLLNFARRMRKAVDSVDKTIRFGYCSCLSNYGIDGVDGEDICLELAGDTAPFMRTIGAPYWASRFSWKTRIQFTIEYTRWERARIREGIEVFSEGDTYPRPRYSCPAAFLEGFDTALRADGSLDGILKYGIDYNSSADYEKGYVERHIDNKPLYEAIDSFFAKKQCTGVRVWEFKEKFESARIPKVYTKSGDAQNLFFSPAAKMLSTLSIPSCYSGEGQCNIALGENARYIPEAALSKGLITDLRGAQILTERGIDVGLLEGDGETSGGRMTIGGGIEYFPKKNERISHGQADVRLIKVKEGAEVESVFETKESGMLGGEVASWKYENAAGQRFYVLGYELDGASDYYWRDYQRAIQLYEAVEYLCGEKLAAFSFGNPDLYILCKKSEDSLAVGLWNFNPDYIKKPEVLLSESYTSVRSFGCDAELCGDKLSLSRLEPYGICVLELKK